MANSHNRHGCLWRNPLNCAKPMAIQHQVTNHQNPRRSETGFYCSNRGL